MKPPTEPRDFGHPPRVLAFWRRLVRDALATGTPTPFYLFSAEPIAEALQELRALEPLPVPVRHWLSCKTQPVAPLLRWWREQGSPIEVVSEFEHRAARHAGFATDDILINGPAKHRWLPRVTARGQRVNFDSPGEMKVLLPLAKQLNWCIGLRLRTSLEHDPEHPEFPTQFGFEPDEAKAALRSLKRAGLAAETLHFHLRTNVASPRIYEQAIREVHSFCAAANWWPEFLDCGGGLPPRHTLGHDGRAFASQFNIADLREVFRRWLPRFTGLRELWLENGRFLSARSGVLVVTVLDVKERAGLRQLICDGGRTMNALVSNWEEHGLFSAPKRTGPVVPTAVHGPTCMAFDQLTRRPLPRSLRPGDRLVWLEAGAYHIPWETRFSHGHAAVLWHEQGKLSRARDAESFGDWWSQWR
ncbi:MAG: diaminopimelate decarboxylase family protein [Limisphaerales bacterium]